MQELIRLENITKDYGRFRALSDVSLVIGPGVTGMLGPNGAGKSTLIKVLLGLVRLTIGSGRVLGYQVGRQAREIRAKVGYMPEDDCYLHGLTGVESVQLAARLSRMQPVEGLRRAHEILDFCGAGQERYRAVQTYSTGMRQKLRFAQAIVHDPPLLILDEPTSGLDPEEREAMLSRIRILATRYEKTVILCTHILPDVQAISDQVVILARGYVVVSESLESLSRPREPSHEIRYLGDGDRLRSRLNDDGIATEASEAPSSFSIPGAGPAALARLWGLAEQEGVGMYCNISGYSRGMRQRTKLAQAIAHDSDLIVLDEPFRGLDPVGRHEMTVLLKERVAQGTSLLFASHVLNEIESITSSFLLICGGRLLASGSAEDVHEMLVDVPNEIEIQCDRPRDLAALLVDEDMTESVKFDPRTNRVKVTTRSSGQLYLRLPKLIEETGIRVQEMRAADASLQELFNSLMRIHRGQG